MRSDWKWIPAAIYGLVLTSLPFPLSTGVQKHHRVFEGVELRFNIQPFSHRRDIAGLILFYRYFHEEFSNELPSLVPPALNFTRKSHALKRSTLIPFVFYWLTCKFHSRKFFPRTTAVWNRLPRYSFPDHLACSCLWLTIILPKYLPLTLSFTTSSGPWGL